MIHHMAKIGKRLTKDTNFLVGNSSLGIKVAGP